MFSVPPPIPIPRSSAPPVAVATPLPVPVAHTSTVPVPQLQPAAPPQASQFKFAVPAPIALPQPAAPVVASPSAYTPQPAAASFVARAPPVAVPLAGPQSPLFRAPAPAPPVAVPVPLAVSAKQAPTVLASQPVRGPSPAVQPPSAPQSQVSPIPQPPPVPAVVATSTLSPQIAMPAPVSAPAPLQPAVVPTSEAPPPQAAPQAAETTEGVKENQQLAASEEEPPRPSYTAYTYPSCAAEPTQTKRIGVLGLQKIPRAIRAAPFVVLDPLAASHVPDPLPPAYIVFGGAMYSCAPSFASLRVHTARSRDQKTPLGDDGVGEMKRHQFMSDQLEVAKKYLKIATHAEKEFAALSVASDGAAGHSSEVYPVSAEEDEAVDLSKANLWTIAYCGSPRQLQAALEAAAAKGAGSIHGKGYVCIRRRQWGLKKSGSGFTIGLGMKATALQFAAAARRIDNVALLLAHGSKDDVSPGMKEMLSKEVYAIVCKGNPAARRRAKTKPVADADNTTTQPQEAPALEEPPVAAVNTV